MHSGARISLRAELARFGLRTFIKGRYRPEPLEVVRQRFRRMERLVPPPPRGTRIEPVSAGGVRAEMVATESSDPHRHVLYLHGGAYTIGSPRLYRHFTWRLANAARARVLAIDYRLAPEHPFPAALEDALAAYRWLLGQGADPRRLAVAGDSAGGGLTLAALMKLRDEGAPLPVAAVAMSPWTDLALTGRSLHANAASDPMLIAAEVPRLARFYVPESEARNPYASPLYGDPAGLPATFIQVGSDEILRDDAVRMAEKMKAAGCEVELQVWPRMPHVFQVLAAVVPEARRAMAEIARFLRANLA
jgi:monoterpene epsilon-lactone hydrolase